MTCAEIGEEEALRLIASVERLSDDPRAMAVVEHALAKGLMFGDATELERLPGGIHARVDGRDVWVGNAELARKHGFADLPELVLERHRTDGATTVVATIDGQSGAILAVADRAAAS